MGGNANGSQNLSISITDDHVHYFSHFFYLYNGENNPSGKEFDLLDAEFPGEVIRWQY